MKNIILLYGCIIMILTLLYLFVFREKFDTVGREIEPQKNERIFSPYKEYTLTLGNWGKEEPAFCYETKPVLSEKGLHICSACKLACSSKKAERRCQKCIQTL